MFTTYILQSAQLDKYYIGYTSGEVAARLQRHLANHKGFTAKAKDWNIVFFKKFETKSEAMAEERKIKSLEK